MREKVMMTTQVDDGEEQSVYYIVMAEVTNKALRAKLTSGTWPCCRPVEPVPCTTLYPALLVSGGWLHHSVYFWMLLCLLVCGLLYLPHVSDCLFVCLLMFGLHVEDWTVVAPAPARKQCTYNGPFAPTCLSLLTQQLVYFPCLLVLPPCQPVPSTCRFPLTGNLSSALPIALSFIYSVNLLYFPPWRIESN